MDSLQNLALLPKPFKEITLNELDLFQQYLLYNPYKISEYTFTNLFMWRKAYQFGWAEFNNILVLAAFYHPGKIVFFPPIPKIHYKDKGEIIQESGLIAKDNNEVVKNALSMFSNFLKNLSLEEPYNEWSISIHRFPSQFSYIIKEIFSNVEIIDDRDNWDYLYKKKELIEMPGKKFANIRKKLNRFYKRYNWEFVRLKEETCPECLELQDAWCKVNICEDDLNLILEHEGIQEILANREKLGFVGGLLRIDGKIVAYTLYEELTPDCYVCHVEKADVNYIGSYQAIMHQFLQQINDKYIWINREQDLGDISLRRSKMSYRPAFLLKKSIINIHKI